MQQPPRIRLSQHSPSRRAALPTAGLALLAVLALSCGSSAPTGVTTTSQDPGAGVEQSTPPPIEATGTGIPVERGFEGTDIELVPQNPLLDTETGVSDSTDPTG